jgi:hypothetical protein
MIGRNDLDPLKSSISENEIMLKALIKSLENKVQDSCLTP